MALKLNLTKIMGYVKKELKSDWKKLNFTYKHEKDEINVAASLTLNNHDDDIRAIINVYIGGGATFRAVFDKIEKTSEVLSLVNDFNDDNLFFKAFVRDDGYLELRHFMVCYDEKIFKDYSGEFLSRLAKLADNKILQKLTKLTHS